MQKDIKVLIADDHPLFRHGLISFIESDDKIQVIGEAENGEIAIELVERRNPDVIILDMDMPVINGLETAQILRDRSIESKIIFLTMHRNKSLLRSLKTLKVNGYVLKDSAMAEIVTCIKAVLSGKTYISAALNELILENFEEDSANFETLPIISSLTKTEKQILSLISKSKTNREIAEELFVSVRTIETHRHNISTKLKLKGAYSLLKFAIKNQDTIRQLTQK